MSAGHSNRHPAGHPHGAPEGAHSPEEGQSHGTDADAGHSHESDAHDSAGPRAGHSHEAHAHDHSGPHDGHSHEAHARDHSSPHDGHSHEAHTHDHSAPHAEHSHGAHPHDAPAHGSHSHGGHPHGSHSHAGHTHGPHSHGADAGERRLTIALAILGTFTLVEGIGGYLANSVALLAEAAHMLTDSASLLLAILAIRMSRRPANVRRTYGHRRYQPLAAFVNGQVLLLLTGWIVYESIVRLMHQPEVNGLLMLQIALIGGVANFAAFVALSGARSLNERSARAHVLSDLLGSAAATGASLLIMMKGWTIADPLLSLLVSVLILRSAWTLTRHSADVLLEGVPAGFDVASVEAELVGHVPGLASVHHIHVWTMTGERPTVTLHAHIAPGASHHETISAIHLRLAQRLRVEHTTVQIEEGPCASPPCE